MGPLVHTVGSAHHDERSGRGDRRAGRGTRSVPDHPTGPHHRDHPWRPVLVRMHFFAGILVGPLIVLAALTGILYVFASPLERVVYAQELTVDPGGRTALPLQSQVEAAVRATPTLRLSGVKAGDLGETTRVDFADPALPPMSAHSVYVDPFTAEVTGSLVTRHGGTPLKGWLGTLHADLHLGTPGRVYAELASHWLAVLTIGGAILWWERSARHGGWRTRRFARRFGLLDRSRRGLHATLSWHGVVGAWTAVLVLVVALTGLMVGVSSGPRWTDLLASQGASAPRISTVIPGATAAVAGPGQLPNGVSVDEVLRGAARVGVSEAVSLTAPKAPGQGWTASETDLTWPVNLDQAVIDPATGAAVRTLGWDSWPVLAQANRLLLVFHFGRTLGPLNDIQLVLSMVAVIALTWWGYRMWWRRRPHGPRLRFGRSPRRGAWRTAPRGLVAVATALLIAWGIVVPVFGLSMLAFLIIDAAIGRAVGHRTPAGTPDVEMVGTGD